MLHNLWQKYKILHIKYKWSFPCFASAHITIYRLNLDLFDERNYRLSKVTKLSKKIIFSGFLVNLFKMGGISNSSSLFGQ